MRKIRQKKMHAPQKGGDKPLTGAVRQLTLQPKDGLKTEVAHIAFEKSTVHAVHIYKQPARVASTSFPTRFENETALAAADSAARAQAAKIDYTNREARRRLVNQIMQEDDKILAVLAK